MQYVCLHVTPRSGDNGIFMKNTVYWTLTGTLPLEIILENHTKNMQFIVLNKK